MPLFVYVGATCREDLARHATTDDVLALERKLEADQSTLSLDRFPAPFLKKVLGGRRLLIEEHRLDDQTTVLCFARFFFRGDRTYDQFLKDPDSVRPTFEPFGAAMLAEFVRKRGEAPPQAWQPLNNADLAYLQPASQAPHDEFGTILETKAWVDRVGHPSVKAHLGLYREVVEEIVNDRKDAERVRRHARSHDLGVVYRFFPAKNWFLLMGTARNEGEESEVQHRDARLLATDPDPDPDSILRASRRAYPAIIVTDRDPWCSLETSHEANLALSPEEAEILNVVRNSNADTPAYPLFINGRPGSGKSTVLQYLFADLLYLHLTTAASEQATTGPLYLTYSRQLQQHARSVVESILRFDAARAVEAPPVDEERLRVTLDGCFGNFREFMRSLLPEADRERFLDHTAVDYPRFLDLWTRRFDRGPKGDVRKLGPEVAWHVIRSYIKGMRESEHDHFDPDCYREHPAKRKSVTDETFGIIYERVFLAWYRDLCEKDGRWDDQDLTRAVLNAGVDLAKHPAVFCDEAQDFTSLELAFLFQLSVYSRRRVPKHLLHRVPFAFAGDPFQTLNPTGFSWSSVQADFHDKIVANLDHSTSHSLAMNFRELAFNYRSADAIVRFCNTIQLARGVLFDLRRLEPQKTWSQGAAPTPVFFADNNPVTQQSLREQEEIVIIVPCHEGGEVDFVADDPFLSTFALSSDGQSLTRNVLSPMRSKGLEFSRVVLYRFGHSGLSHARLAQGLETPAPLFSERESALPLEYFFSQLYVGASRAQIQLLLVDTVSALESFWSRLYQPKLATTLLGAYRALHSKSTDFAWGEADLGRLDDGEVKSWTAHADPPEELAQKFFERGRDVRDPFFVRQALAIYERLARQKEALRCRALLHDIAGEMSPAGDIYAQLGEYRLAVDCYWRDDAWQKLAALPPETVGERRAEIRAGAFLSAPPTNFEEASRFLADFQNLLDDPVHRARCRLDERWARVLGTVVERLGAIAGGQQASQFAPERWAEVYSRIVACRSMGVALPPSLLLAQVAAAARLPRDAVELWRQSAGPKGEVPIWIAEALAEIGDYPERLVHQHRLERWADIVTVFEQHPSERLPQEHARIVKEAYARVGWNAVGIALVLRQPTEEHLANILYGSRTPETERQATAVVHALLQIFEAGARWSDLIEFARFRRLSGRQPRADSTLRAVEDLRVKEDVLRLLASSEPLASEKIRDAKKLVSDYLDLEYVAKKRGTVQVRLLAGALERAGHQVLALTFYEQCIGGHWAAGEDVVRFARDRWLVCKERQVEILSSERRSAAQKELTLAAERWSIPLEHLRTLARFPETRSEAAGEERARPAEMQKQLTGLLESGRIVPVSADPPVPFGTESDATSPKSPESQAIEPEEPSTVGDAEEAPGDLAVTTGPSASTPAHTATPLIGDPSATSAVPSAAWRGRVSLRVEGEGLLLDGRLHISERRLVLLQDDGTSLTVSAKGPNVGSAELTIRLIERGTSRPRYVVEEWDIEVRLEVLNEKLLVEVRRGDSTVFALAL